MGIAYTFAILEFCEFSFSFSGASHLKPPVWPTKWCGQKNSHSMYMHIKWKFSVSPKVCTLEFHGKKVGHSWAKNTLIWEVWRSLWLLWISYGSPKVFFWNMIFVKSMFQTGVTYHNPIWNAKYSFVTPIPNLEHFKSLITQSIMHGWCWNFDV